MSTLAAKPCSSAAAAAARFRGRITILALLLGVVFLLSLLWGKYPEPGLIPLHLLGSDALARELVFNIRLPRIVMALLLGAALASAGNVFQMIFGNPMVEPGFLGVSQGAAFGAGLCLLFLSRSLWAVQLTAALFGLLGLGLSYYLARKIRYGGWVLRLILSGIAVSALFNAGIGLIKYGADPMTELPEITFWILGGLYSVEWPDVAYAAPPVLAASLLLWKMRWRLNILSLNDDTAFSLGARPGRERFLLLSVAAAATAAVVSVAGIIGWAGLIVPHIVRRLFRTDGRWSVPGSLLGGALFMLICDDLARLLLPGEIPLGIITSCLGAVLFILVLATRYVRFKP